MEHLDFQLTADFYATPDEVFAALTHRDYIEAWSNAEGYIEPKIGGRLSYFNGEITGTVKAIDPGFSLAASWTPFHLKDLHPESEVLCRLAPEKRRTKVFISMKNLPNPRERDFYRQHWQERILQPLNRFFDLE